MATDENELKVFGSTQYDNTHTEHNMSRKWRHWNQ